MDHAPIQLRYYETAGGRFPFGEWLHTLDVSMRQRVQGRLSRVRLGHMGDAEPVGEGVFEIKLDMGPGYRIYYGLHGRELVILLYAGDKRRQAADINKAKGYWRDYRRRSII